jgi:hypothetical protein
MKKRWQLRQADGQSLVEMALVLPVFLLMLVGLIEIGAALYSYLVVVNANREGTRFAARGHWFGDDDRAFVFQRVVQAGGFDRQGRPILRTESIDDLEPNAKIAIHYIQVPDQVDNGAPSVEPPIVYGPWYSGTLPYLTRIDADAVAEETRQENYAFNEEYFIQEGALDNPSADDFVIVEIWYEHEQLLKLPIFTSILPETFTLYSRGHMRVTFDSRVQ